MRHSNVARSSRVARFVPLHAAFAVSAAVALSSFTGCAAPSDAVEDELGTTQEALVSSIGDISAPPPPAPRRRIIRSRDVGCPTVPGTNGDWIGDPIASASGTSHAFCAYGWRSSTNAAPDNARLDPHAVFDAAWGAPYNIPDTRPSNTDVPQGSVQVAANAQVPSLTIIDSGDPLRPRRSSGCDVCVSLEGNVLWVVLPPEAALGTVNVVSNSVVYPVSAPSSAFYAAKPSGLSGTPKITYLLK